MASSNELTAADFIPLSKEDFVPVSTERTDPRLPYQQTPEGQAVAERYGVLPRQLEEARETVSTDIASIPRVTAKTMIRGLPAAAGASIGAGAGPLGAILGGGLGYSIGGRLEELFGLEERPTTMGEAMSRAAEDIPVGAAYEAGGQMAGGALQKILAPRVGKITPQGEQLRSTLEKAGVTASPLDVAPGRALGKLESLAEKQIGGGRIADTARREITAMRGDPNTGTEGWLAKEARRVGGPEHQMDASRVARGETIQAGLKDLATTNRQLAGIEWDALKSYDTGTADFPIDNLRNAMRGKMEQAGVFQQAINPQTSSRLASPGGRMTPEGTFVTERMVQGTPESQIVSGLARGEGPITFEQARSVRSALGELYEQDPKRWGGPLSALRNDLDAYAAAHPERGAVYDRARRVYKENVVPFDRGEPLGQLIDRNEPISVVQELMQPRDARINLLRAIKQQTGGRGPVWQATNSEAVTQALENPRVLTNMGPETKGMLFTPEQRAFLDELQNWMQTTSAIRKVGGSEFAKTGQNVVALEGLREGVGAARQFATLVLGGSAAAAGGAAGSLPGILAGGTIALTPAIVARMLTNPKAAYWLTQGIKMPAGSPEAIRVASQLYPAYIQAVSEEGRETKQREMSRMFRGAR